MKNELILILNEIKKFNKEIVNIEKIITHINKCHAGAHEADWETYKIQNKDVIHDILNSEANKKLSNFNTLKSVINTYLFLLYRFKSGDVLNKELQLA
jgi:hypothetical protein